MSLEMNYWAHTQELMDIVDDFIMLYEEGYDINDESIQGMVFRKHLFDELTDYDKDYIKIEVERRI